MDEQRHDAFVSYAHDDNDRNQGRLLALLEQVADEYSLVHDHDLTFFIDRSSIEWGQQWRTRIDDALGEAPLFLAIITPKFVRSAECRRELLAFVREAEIRGFQKLLLPLLYLPVEGIQDNSADEVLAVVARTQYVDWTANRLLSPGDPRILSGVADLVKRIGAIRKEASQTALEVAERASADPELTLSAVVNAIGLRLEGWMDAVEFDSIASQQWTTTVRIRYERVRRLIGMGARPITVVATWDRLGEEVLPIAAGRLEKAKIYSKLSIELDPLITAALRLVRERPHSMDVLAELRDGTEEAMINILPSEGRAGYSSPDGLRDFSKTLLRAEELMDEAEGFVDEANEIVLRWKRELDEVLGPTDTTPRLVEYDARGD